MSAPEPLLTDDELLASYDWLRDALRPHCDQVIHNISDFGTCLGIGVSWGEGVNRKRQAIIVQRASRYRHVPLGSLDSDTEPDFRLEPTPVVSINADIAARKITREQVIDSLLKCRSK